MIQEYKITVEGKHLPDLSKDMALSLDCAFITDQPTKITKVKVVKIK